MGKVAPIAERFWRYVDKSEGCWLWTGTHLPTGYGTIKGDRSRRHLYAHRVSWELHNGPVPAGMYVCHHCDTPSCVRPEHLFIGTNRDNMKDCARKGRARGCTVQKWHGEKSPVAKLTWEAVRDIRASGLSLKALARKYGVTSGTIWKVKKERIWNVA